MTRGTSLLEAAHAVRDVGAEVVLLVAVVDRGGTVEAMAAAEGLAFRAILSAAGPRVPLRGGLTRPAAQKTAIGLTGDAVPRRSTSGATVRRNSQRCSSAHAVGERVEVEVVHEVDAHGDDDHGVDRASARRRPGTAARRRPRRCRASPRRARAATGRQEASRPAARVPASHGPCSSRQRQRPVRTSSASPARTRRPAAPRPPRGPRGRRARPVRGRRRPGAQGCRAARHGSRSRPAGGGCRAGWHRARSRSLPDSRCRASRRGRCGTGRRCGWWRSRAARRRCSPHPRPR